MKIFKHRGDIYIPKTEKKNSKQKRILYLLLILVVLVTAAVLIIAGKNYDYSLKEFVKPEKVQFEKKRISQNNVKASGNANFLFIISNENTNELYCCAVVRADVDEMRYSSAVILPGTNLDGSSIKKIYKSGGAESVLNAVNKNLGTDIEYYVDDNYRDFSGIADDLGQINYTIAENISYKDTSKYGYNLKIDEGDRQLDGDDIVKLLRYYCLKKKDCEEAENLILQFVSQNINETNYEKKEEVFSDFINISKTNITVKEFTSWENALSVLSNSKAGTGIYALDVKYEKGKMTSETISNIKEEFS